MLHLHFANRHETLRTLLLQRLADGRGDVFRAEPVIVPNAAHRRALSLAIADAFGICANLQFGYLALWLWQQVAKLVPRVGVESPFAATTLAWRVWAAFGDADFVGTFPRLAGYLHGADALMRYELAGRVATLFEQYVTYRADWLQAWAAGQGAAPLAADDADQAWQAALWRRIAGEVAMPGLHPRQAFADALRRDGARLAESGVLPPRAHVFALPTIAPLHLQMLQPLAACIDVHLYALNPCREYWYEVVSPRRLARLAARGQDAGHEVGNRLLASWGRQAQAQLETLDALCGEQALDDAHYTPAAGDSLLAALQNAVLELRELAPGSLRPAAQDRSIELHVCHSLSRELEVLQDHLLGLFAADPGLRPCDVLVLTPDLERAAPLIDALFGTAPQDRFIAYTLASRRRERANLPARTLFALLALAGSRCTATELYAVLQQPLVARRFGLDEEGLDRVRGWLQAAGFRWAIDAPQVAALDLPADGVHTLDHGLQRLFLGHALPAEVAEPFAGLLPAGDAEGSAALELGALWRFAGALGGLQRTLATPKSPQQWVPQLCAVLDDFMLADGDMLDDLRELREAIVTMADHMALGGVAQPLPLALVRQALQQVLDDPARGGVAGGGITFASISALRALPFAVVCAIGLNDGAFPSVQRPAEFDLMARQPRPGDRRPRDDERSLMLDLLLAARRSLYLSHTGRSVRDNSPLPPSVLVAELLELLVEATADDPASPAALARARARLVVEHPLQPFSVDAFRIDGSEPRRRSFNRELAEALRHGLAAATPQRASTVAAAAQDLDDDDADEDQVADPQQPFFRVPLAAPGPEWHTPTLAQLMRFFRNPCRALLRRRLRIELLRADDELQDDEVLAPDRAARQALAQRLMPALLRGLEGEALQSLARAGGEMPSGALGGHLLQRELAALQAFAAALRRAGAAPCLEPLVVVLPIEVDGRTWRLQAGFDTLRASGLLGWRYGETRAGDYLDAWLQHLALCAAAPPGVAPQTRWISSDGEFSLAPCADAPTQLAGLLRLYERGLSAPLHFFARSAWAYVRWGHEQARGCWDPAGRRPYPEGADPAYRLALRGVADPLDERFESSAQAVFGPLLEHLRDARVVT